MFRAECRIVQCLAYRPHLGAKPVNSPSILASVEVHMTFANVAFDAVRVSPDSGSLNSDDGY